MKYSRSFYIVFLSVIASFVTSLCASADNIAPVIVACIFTFVLFVQTIIFSGKFTDIKLFTHKTE